MAPEFVLHHLVSHAGVHLAVPDRSKRFWLTAALAPTDLELVDGGLREILALPQDDAGVADHLARLRAASSHAERATLWQSLAHGLAQRGSIDLSHALSVSLNSRLLRRAALQRAR